MKQHPHSGCFLPAPRGTESLHVTCPLGSPLSTLPILSTQLHHKPVQPCCSPASTLLRAPHSRRRQIPRPSANPGTTASDFCPLPHLPPSTAPCPELRMCGNSFSKPLGLLSRRAVSLPAPWPLFITQDQSQNCLVWTSPSQAVPFPLVRSVLWVLRGSHCMPVIKDTVAYDNTSAQQRWVTGCGV